MRKIVKLAEELLKAWDSPETESHLISRRIAPWKWRCYALVAGVVDGRKWKGTEVARERNLSRARICVVLKEVERNLSAEDSPACRLYRQLRKFDLCRAVSVCEAFGLDGGRKEEFGKHCYPDVVNSVFVAAGRDWKCEKVTTVGRSRDYRVFVLHCCEKSDSRVPETMLDSPPPGINVHPIVVDCGGSFYVLDHMETTSRIARILLKPLG